MIKLIEAWQCSDGDCYEDKEAAYSQEFKVLMQKLPTMKRPLAADLKRAIESAERWMLQANEMNDRIKSSPKDEKLLIVVEFKKMAEKVKKWLDDAQALIRQIAEEPDPKIKRAMSEQGG